MQRLNVGGKKTFQILEYPSNNRYVFIYKINLDWLYLTGTEDSLVLKY